MQLAWVDTMINERQEGGSNVLSDTRVRNFGKGKGDLYNFWGS